MCVLCACNKFSRRRRVLNTNVAEINTPEGKNGTYCARVFGNDIVVTFIYIGALPWLFNDLLLPKLSYFHSNIFVQFVLCLVGTHRVSLSQWMEISSESMGSR